MDVELLIRFVFGGVVVSLFAAIAEMLEPKTFAGIFGAAPSVALATLILAFHEHGGAYVALEARAMIVGAIALLAYSVACVAIAKRERVPIGLGAAAAWLVWIAAALGLWQLGTTSGVL
jgi:hypothetical protein